jgi:hypothetical protein
MDSGLEAHGFSPVGLCNCGPQALLDRRVRGPGRQIGERLAHYLLPPQMSIGQGTLIDVQDQPIRGENRDAIHEALQQIAISLFILVPFILERQWFPLVLEKEFETIICRQESHVISWK